MRGWEEWQCVLCCLVNLLEHMAVQLLAAKLSVCTNCSVIRQGIHQHISLSSPLLLRSREAQRQRTQRSSRRQFEWPMNSCRTSMRRSK